jgi:hypothetical protein
MGHSKNELLTSRVAKGESRIGVGHDGRAQGIHDRPAMHGPAYARATEPLETPNNIARKGAGKAHHVVPAVYGQRVRNEPMRLLPDGKPPDASSPEYLDIEPKNAKQLQQVASVSGQRSRTSGALDHDLGQRILDEALRTR